MNPKDIQNLKFIIRSDPNDLQRWYATLSYSDAAYAMQLAEEARAIIKYYGWDQFNQMLDSNAVDQPVEDLSQARELLKRFMLS